MSVMRAVVEAPFFHALGRAIRSVGGRERPSGGRIAGDVARRPDRSAARAAAARRRRAFRPAWGVAGDRPVEPRLMLDGGVPGGMTLAQANWFYHNTFAAPAQVAPEWNGDVASADAGSLGANYLAAIVARINAYRWMAGLPGGITLDAAENAQAQQAALMMSANRQLSHFPPTNWVDYTPAGAAAAGRSNLSLGSSGVRAIDGYMTDLGDNNTAVGHRRWLLNPPTRTMGVGDIPAPPSGYYLPGGFPPANALQVIQPDTPPAPNITAVAWPPAGFVPAPLMPERWSLQLGGPGDFSAATVSVTRAGVAQPVEILSVNGGYAGPAIVWDLPTQLPEEAAVYLVRVDNVLIHGQPQSFSYTTTSFDPESTTATERVPARVELLQPVVNASTEGGSAVVEVARSLDAATTVSVAYATEDGTGRAGVDYQATTGVLTFAPGQFYAQIVVPILSGNARNPGATFSIRLSSPSGATLDTGGAIQVNTSPSLLPAGTAFIGERRIRAGKGKKAVTRFQLIFNGPLDLLTAQSTGSYHVYQMKKKHPKQVAVRAAVVNQSLDRVTLTLSGFLKNQPVFVTASGLRDAGGLRINPVNTVL